MLKEKTFLISLIVFIAIIPVLAQSQGGGGPDYDDGESCTDNSDCKSKECHDDFNTSNGAFCTKDGNSCVHLIDGDTLATQYNDNDAEDIYICDRSVWKKQGGETCTQNSECNSGSCGSDYNTSNSDYCTEDSSSCIHLVTGDTIVTHYADGDTSDIYVCDNSAWKMQPGQPCTIDYECDSGHCHTDYESSNGDFCAEAFGSCVHLVLGDPVATQYNNNAESDIYKCNNGNWVVPDADKDEVSDNKDDCPGTTIDCTVSNGLIDPSNGCPFEPYRFHSSLEEYDDETCAVGSFGVYAEPLCGSSPYTEITYYVGSTEKSTCDTYGDELWPWPEDNSKYMCPIENLTTPGIGTYDLRAVYDYPAPTEILISDIRITNECNPSVHCLHALSITDDSDALTAKPYFSSDFYIDGSDYVCCEDTSVGISNINALRAVCSNGVSQSDVPSVVGWIYHEGNYQWLSINNAFTVFYSRCISRTTRRDNVIGGGSLNVGYIPVTDCSSPSLVGSLTSSSSTNRYILSEGGRYEIVTDIIQTACDSPSAYICPWESNSRESNLCNTGVLNNWQESNGWLEYKTFNINVISPSVSLGILPPSNTYYIYDPYIPPVRKVLSFDIDNDGTGNIILSDFNLVCPPELSCEVSPSSEIVVDEGDSGTVQFAFNLPCDYSRNEYPIEFSFVADDAYDIGCMEGVSETVTTTIIQGSVSDDSPGACECYTGKTDMWDDGMGCCDVGDCWVSQDGSWICDSGNRIEGARFCDVENACGQDWNWNGSAWLDYVPPGCGCDSSEECGECICVENVCMDLTNPTLSFMQGAGMTARLGDTVNAVISVKNNLPVKDNIKLNIYASPQKMTYWTKFSNSERSITIPLEAGEEKSLALSIFCGEKGQYSLTLSAESGISSSLQTHVTKTLSIVGDDSGFSSSSPGLAAYALTGILLIAMSIVYHKRKKNRKIRYK